MYQDGTPTYLVSMTPNEPTDAIAFAQAIGHELRDLREQRGLTRHQVEDASGLSRSTVQRIENGQRAADAVQLARIVGAIDSLDSPDFPAVTVSLVVTRAEAMVRSRSRAMGR